MVDKAGITSIDDTTYEVEMPSGEKAEIGDRNSLDFKPCLKLYRFDGECFAKVWLSTKLKKSPVIEDNKVKWVEPNLEAHFYPLEPRMVIAKDKDGKDHRFTQNELGGFEFEVILKKKPKSNKIILNIETQGLRFSYQPPLTQEEIDAGSIRPDNVVGSYAVYHKTKKNNQYMTGKAFHIYRPKAEDALGNKAWCSIQFDKPVDPTSLTLTVPQQFLDEATYPVTIDPEFGYQSEGGSMVFIAKEDEGANNYRTGSACTMPAGGGTANYIRAYVQGDHICDCKVFINQKDSGGVGTHGQIAGPVENEDCVTALHWEEFTLGSEALAEAVDYILNIVGDGSDMGLMDYYGIRYDDNGSVASYYEYHNYAAPESPWAVAAEGTTRDYSIYCNYSEAAPPPGLENKSANMAAKMIAGKLI